MKKIRSRKLLNDTASFQPKELKLFEPDLNSLHQSVKNDASVPVGGGGITISQTNSPLALLSKDASNNSLSKKMKGAGALANRDSSTSFKKTATQH